MTSALNRSFELRAGLSITLTRTATTKPTSILSSTVRDSSPEVLSSGGETPSRPRLPALFRVVFSAGATRVPGTPGFFPNPGRPRQPRALHIPGGRASASTSGWPERVELGGRRLWVPQTPCAGPIYEAEILFALLPEPKESSASSPVPRPTSLLSASIDGMPGGVCPLGRF